MAVSITLDKCVEKGAKQGYPEGLAGLGYFESTGIEKNAENVFVLVVHYDFKDGAHSWPRFGDEKDVENLRNTFAKNRNCAFRECSPKKEVLITLLQDEKKLQRFFGAPEEPDVFFLIILSHGSANGVIFTDFLRSPDPNDYETFTTKDLLKSINDNFPKCLKIVFLETCRGELEDSVFHRYQAIEGHRNDLTRNQNSSRVSFEPKMLNLIIFCSTVETTRSKGTWVVTALCEVLNEMRQKLDVANFLTGVQNKIHKKTFGSFYLSRQTPVFKMFPCDRKFFFHPLGSKVAGTSNRSMDGKSKIGSSEEEKPLSIHFDWFNPQTKKVFRGRRAVIFHYGEKSVHIEKLDTALVTNLGFETIDANINKDGLHFYLSQSDKSWSDCGCFAAFFFAEIAEEEDGEVCIWLNENKRVIPIGKLIHGLLGPKNGDWIGKSKLFFFVDTKSVATTHAVVEKKNTMIIFSARPITQDGSFLLFGMRLY
ncbi:uncharacterized protein LOC132201315 isoform X2 [Neocloeon triangulifer]|uniref:uncharacterized protein LOC132201315 isoform X2 n=1 Tax=Neocloeon triangulifer TaxID=2078957 RepID=UPI00286ED398|nr:uncharacterized protein LOC132201315 isoform X2 [Neocloeon triangulifer]